MDWIHNPKDGTFFSVWIGSTQLFENKDDATNPIVNDTFVYTFVIVSALSFAADIPQNSLTTSYFLVVKSPMFRHFWCYHPPIGPIDPENGSILENLPTLSTLI
jgi:hypothetical protein